jgi:hypothetical protein
VSFVIVPLKGKKFKMIIVLRALTLLDSTPLKVSYGIIRNIYQLTIVPQDAEKAKYYEHLQEIPRPFSLKRKVGYYEDDEEETRVRMHRMSIDRMPIDKH